jgi:putative FmdB family regulatory protein
MQARLGAYDDRVAAYDYRCRVCERTFEVRRPISATSETVACPAGHQDVSRVWSPVAVGSASSPRPAAGGGCCGGGCCG